MILLNYSILSTHDVQNKPAVAVAVVLPESHKNGGANIRQQQSDNHQPLRQHLEPNVGVRGRNNGVSVRHDEKQKQLLARGMMMMTTMNGRRSSAAGGMNGPAPGYANSHERSPFPSNITIAGSPTAWQVLHERLDAATTRVVRLHNTTAKCPNTIVTAYFNVKSKYQSDKYNGWMANILSLQSCMVIFTEPASVDIVTRLRQHALPKTVIVVQDSVDALPVSKLYMDTHPTFWQDQLLADRERKRHQSYQLFWIWLSKSWWVAQAVAENYFDSGFYLYSDIGCFRTGQYNNRSLIQHADLVPADKVLWMAHHKPNPPATAVWNDKFGEKDNFFHSGSQGAGTATAWLRFHDVFCQTMDRFAAAHLFLGEDQCVLQSACMSPYTGSLVSKASSVGVCSYAPFDQVPDNHYFGIRYVLNRGGEHYQFWTPPILTDAS